MKQKHRLDLFTIFSLILLLLSSPIMINGLSTAKAQETYFIDLGGFSWDHSTINASVIPQENETWWNPSYLNATLHAIGQWNDAVYEFGTEHPEFSYLTSIKVIPTINHEAEPGFDMYISWVGECGDETRIGQSEATIKRPCTTTKNTVCLAAKAPSGHVMTEVDMQNIAVHELGHTFGLSHCNYSGDVMYYRVSYRNTVKPLSSLDLYALSTIFEWMPNATQSSSLDVCPQESSVTLPAGINYYHIPISSENVPLLSQQNLTDSIIALLFRAETITIIFVTVTLLAVVVIIRKRRKKSA